MDHCTIGAALKRKHITQKQVIDILHIKYGLKISQPTFNSYAKRYWYRDTPTWRVIRECLEEEFGIVYVPTHWN